MGDGQLTGVVTKMHTDKGFGFIKANGLDYFFHKSGVERSSPTAFGHIAEGMTATFVVEDSPKGPRAAQVMVE